MSGTSLQSVSALPAANYARYSSDQQDPVSIEQQRSACRPAAERDGYVTPPEFEFADAAVSGTTLHRAGLDALLDAAAAGKIAAVYFHGLSRLARELVISLPILKTLVYVNKVRVVSVSEGVDSNRNGWDLMAMFLGFQHEHTLPS